MQHVFFFEALHQPVGDEFVIIRSSQVLRDVLERKQEAGKIFIPIKCIDLGLRNAFATPLSQFDQRSRLDRAFEVQMQLGLGKKSQKTIRRPIECGGHHSLIVESCLNICEAGRICYFFANSLRCLL